jgi:DNA-directed RNA polymerase specialized sigma24 family protein
VLGAENLSLAEDVVQESLVQALRTWPFRGVPENPGGWLMQVAKNRAPDLLRREASLAARRKRFGSGSPRWPLRRFRCAATCPARHRRGSLLKYSWRDAGRLSQGTITIFVLAQS